jgi:hypothetical protein
MKFLILLLYFSYHFCLASDLSGEEIANLKNEWTIKEPEVYKYILRYGGVFGYTLHKISIRKNKCTAMSRFIFGNNKSRWKKRTCKGYKIEDLLLSVQEQEQRGVYRSEIKVNAQYGFISYYSAEPKTEDTDQDWYFEVLKFVAK